MRQPGVEPGSAAWKATMLTVTPLTLLDMSLLAQFTSSSIFTGQKTGDAGGIRTLAGRAQWISSPSP